MNCGNVVCDGCDSTAGSRHNQPETRPRRTESSDPGHPVTPPPARRVVAVPSLWAPLHHRPAVAALAAFVAKMQPDAVVFLHAPADIPQQARKAFLNEVAKFRATYRGKIMVHGYTHHDTAAFARLNVLTLPESAPIVPGWLAAAVDLHAQPHPVVRAATADTNVVCGGTGRLRLTGRAVPADHGTMRAWLVFECGTLAADPVAGTLGFGVLEIDGTTVTARPVRVGTDGSFTYRGTRFEPPELRSHGADVLA
jgi:hypothetical protein